MPHRAPKICQFKTSYRIPFLLLNQMSSKCPHRWCKHYQGSIATTTTTWKGVKSPVPLWCSRAIPLSLLSCLEVRSSSFLKFNLRALFKNHFRFPELLTTLFKHHVAHSICTWLGLYNCLIRWVWQSVHHPRNFDRVWIAWSKFDSHLLSTIAMNLIKRCFCDPGHLIIVLSLNQHATSICTLDMHLLLGKLFLHL